MTHLSPLVDIDEPSPEVVRVTITDEGQVFQEHTHIGHCWGYRGSKFFTVVLVVSLNEREREKLEVRG